MKRKIGVIAVVVILCVVMGGFIWLMVGPLGENSALIAHLNAADVAQKERQQASIKVQGQVQTMTGENLAPLEQVLKQGGGWTLTPSDPRMANKTYTLVYPVAVAKRNQRTISDCLQELAAAETLQLPFDFSVSRQTANDGTEYYELTWSKGP